MTERGGRLASVTGPDGRIRKWGYYPRGLVRSEWYGFENDFSGEEGVEQVQYTYDAAGNIQTAMKGAGADAQTWSYDYAPTGELMSVSLPGALGSFGYGYEGRRKLTGITPPGSPQRTFEYDYLGREVSRTRGSATWSTTWAYGAGTMIEPTGSANLSTPTRVVTELDGRGRVARREYQPGSEVVNDDLYREEYRYDERNQIVLVRERRKSGDQQSRHTYDKRGRVLSVERSGAGALSVVEQVGYTWKPFDELESMGTPSGGSVMYTYDERGRVSTLAGPHGVLTLGWEAGGQRLATVQGSATERRCYDGAGRVTRMVSGSIDHGCAMGLEYEVLQPLAGYEYSYDGRGNRLTEKYLAAGMKQAMSTSYAYDVADRLVGVGYDNGSATLYGLAGDGTRVGEKRIDWNFGPLPEYAGAPNPRTHLTYSQLLGWT